MRAGSAELYSYLAENQARLNRPKVINDKEQIQTRLQGILNDLMRENNRTLANIRDGLPKLGSDG